MLKYTAVTFFILAAMPSSCNTNKKYVKGAEIVTIGGALDDGAVDFCGLGNQVLTVREQLRQSVDNPNFWPHAERLADEKGNPTASVRVLERSLVGNGAHREVHSAISLDVNLAKSASQISVVDDCEVVILEHLSSGVFADAFQLHRLQQQEAVKYAHIYGDADLERPAKSSFRSIIELRQRLVPAKKGALEAYYESEVTLPLHARYPPTSPGSHSVVNITAPDILVACGREQRVAIDSTAKSKPELCIYAALGDEQSKLPVQHLQWWIPSGYPFHSAWVGRLTTSTGLVGVAIVFVACRLSGSKHGGGSKS